MFVYLANSCDFPDLHEKRYKINIYYPFGDSFKLYPDPLLNVLSYVDLTLVKEFRVSEFQRLIKANYTINYCKRSVQE